MSKRISSKNLPLHRQAITELRGVGPAVAEKLEQLRLYTIQDALFHLPLRYQDRTTIRPIGGIQAGEEILISGKVVTSQVVFRKRRSLLVALQDGTGTITLRFFYFNKSQEQSYKPGVVLNCFGEVRRGPNSWEMIHPEVKPQHDSNIDTEHALTPIYPATDGIHQNTLRKIINAALEYLTTKNDLVELVPAVLLPRTFPELKDAILIAHRPPPDIDIESLKAGTHFAIKRLAFEELMAYQLTMQALRRKMQAQTAPVIDSDKQLINRFIDNLPFDLTNAQKRVSHEIERDLIADSPMLRLVQGDVGSGKTAVAAMAACLAVEAGYQVAIMAPTDLLAEQHHRQFEAWFKPLDVTIGWLSGKSAAKARRQQMENISMGIAGIIIGTHALFQDEVVYDRLGLVIIDEQHRFGVDQRLTLVNKGQNAGIVPHQLTMTATPIPRTLAMTAYADFDCSVIDELPPGRTPVETAAVDVKNRPRLIERLQTALEEGRQAYWVCTLIEESEVIPAQAAEDATSLLIESLPGHRIGLVHGRLKAAEKDAVMQAFASHELDLLVATTVIEVGVNVPNASLMIIENAERLGLAQLHQLRGRVGRGSTASHCVLLVKGPLSEHAQQRINVMRSTNDGFEIAEKDLQIRGAGEFLGTKQTGDLQFRIADLQRDQAMLTPVKQAAQTLLEAGPGQADALIQRWLGPQATRYGSV